MKILLNKKKAQSLVELSIILPILFMFLFGIMEFGCMFMRYISASEVVKKAGRLASKNFSPEYIRTKLGFSSLNTNSNVIGSFGIKAINFQYTYNENNITQEVMASVTVVNTQITPLSNILKLFGGSGSILPQEFTLRAIFRMEEDRTSLEQYTPPQNNNENPTQLNPPLTDDLGFTHQLISCENNGDGTKTLTFKITSDSSTSTPALSHIVYGIPTSCENLGNQHCDCDHHSWTHEWCNPDPTTGVSGLKFDNATLGEDGVSECATVSFVVYDWVDQVTIGVKAGNQTQVINYSFISN